jgi:hypothetical protein
MANWRDILVSEKWFWAVRCGFEYRGTTPNGGEVRWIQTPMDRAREIYEGIAPRHPPSNAEGRA